MFNQSEGCFIWCIEKDIAWIKKDCMQNKKYHTPHSEFIRSNYFHYIGIAIIKQSLWQHVITGNKANPSFAWEVVLNSPMFCIGKERLHGAIRGQQSYTRRGSGMKLAAIILSIMAAHSSASKYPCYAYSLNNTITCC